MGAMGHLSGLSCLVWIEVKINQARIWLAIWTFCDIFGNPRFPFLLVFTNSANLWGSHWTRVLTFFGVWLHQLGFCLDRHIDVIKIVRCCCSLSTHKYFASIKDSFVSTCCFLGAGYVSVWIVNENFANRHVSRNCVTGVYIPFLWDSSFCWKSPISLGYTRGHFSALVPMETDLDKNIGAGAMPDNKEEKRFYLPLIDKDGIPLPLHFLTQSQVRLSFITLPFGIILS